MFAIDIEFKNGNKLEGLVWGWHPENGYVEVLDETNGNIKKYKLAEVYRGTIYSDRVRNLSRADDLLEKARQEGFCE